MGNLIIPADARTLSIEWYVPDHWYGSRYRLVLVPDETLSFASDSEAKRYAGKLAKWASQRYLRPTGLQPVKSGDAIIEKYGELPTYVYVSLGPTYSCQNIILKVSELL